MGVKLMPHRHPEDRVYTVMSGVFYIGLGDQFNADKLHAYPPGSVIVLPGNTYHYHWAKSSECVTPIGDLWDRPCIFKKCSRAFNDNEPSASHQTRIDKQMSNPRFNAAAVEIVLSGQIDTLEKYGRVLDQIPG